MPCKSSPSCQPILLHIHFASLLHSHASHRSALRAIHLTHIFMDCRSPPPISFLPVRQPCFFTCGYNSPQSLLIPVSTRLLWLSRAPSYYQPERRARTKRPERKSQNEKARTNRVLFHTPRSSTFAYPERTESVPARRARRSRFSPHQRGAIYPQKREPSAARGRL